MTAHAGAPGLGRCIADRASAAAPAGTRHRAGLAGAVAAAATVANRMARVAARALALARRRVAGRADGAVTGTAAEHRDSRGTQEFRRARCQRAGAKLVQPSDRGWDSLRTLHSVAGEPPRGIRGTSSRRRGLDVRLGRLDAQQLGGHLDPAARFRHEPAKISGVRRLGPRVLHLVALEVVGDRLPVCAGERDQQEGERKHMTSIALPGHPFAGLLQVDSSSQGPLSHAPSLSPLPPESAMGFLLLHCGVAVGTSGRPRWRCPGRSRGARSPRSKKTVTRRGAASTQRRARPHRTVGGGARGQHGTPRSRHTRRHAR